ncbi:MAG: helix-turn-helix domain-containing protein [Solirubrobacterales bacterium]
MSERRPHLRFDSLEGNGRPPDQKRHPVLRSDPDLLAAVPAEHRRLALRACLAPVVEVAAGHWTPPAQDPSGLGLLIVSGTLCRRVHHGRQHGAELLGPGDLLRPGDGIDEWSSIESDAAWHAINGARVALLDAEFARRAAHFPGLSVAFVHRALLRSRYLAVLLAIAGERRVDSRLEMVFWHLADRFGSRCGDWVKVPVPVTHGVLSELVAARRPSVTTAMGRLESAGLVVRSGDGWRLLASMATNRPHAG